MMSVVRFRKLTTNIPVALMTSIAFVLSGCAHPLTLKNIDLYRPVMVSSQLKDVKLGISTSTSSPEEERLVASVINALKRDGFKITSPFFPTEENNRTVDYVLKLTTSSEYKGSGWNFLINWPGFLIWTPAWHGYNYRAIYGFDADITNTKTGTNLPRVSSPIDLEIRHADMNRTWTEISWFEWSMIAFIGGLIFTRYDKSVTPLLINAAEHRIGDYVASKIEAALSST